MERKGGYLRKKDFDSFLNNKIVEQLKMKNISLKKFSVIMGLTKHELDLVSEGKYDWDISAIISLTEKFQIKLESLISDVGNSTQ